MGYFLDTERADDGERFELISIALISEDGREHDAAVSNDDSAAVNPRVERQPEPGGVHNALVDARYHKRIDGWLRSVQSGATSQVGSCPT